MSQTADFEVGRRLRVVLPGDVQRNAVIVAVDPNGEEVKVRWVNYSHLPDEWIPVRWL